MNTELLWLLWIALCVGALVVSVWRQECRTRDNVTTYTRYIGG